MVRGAGNLVLMLALTLVQHTAGCRSEILAKSARAEFEAARHEKVCHTPTLVAESHAGAHTIANVDVVPVQDPLVIARMLVIGQDAVMQMQDKVCVCVCLSVSVSVSVCLCLSACVCVYAQGLMWLASQLHRVMFLFQGTYFEVAMV